MALLSACSSRYFHAADPPAGETARHALATWPSNDYWTGFVFNGAKIGFSHLHLSPVPASTGDGDDYELRSDTSLALHFLGVQKKIQFQTRDVVDAELRLLHFAYVDTLDDSRRQIQGEVAGEELHVTVITKDSRDEQRIPLRGPLYPSSAIALYPVLHGLEVGRRFRYDVYDGELMRISTVEQEVLGYETSDLFRGAAYKVRTRMQGQQSTTWIDARGRPLLEIALNGVLIAALEDEGRARGYLATASLNKQDVMLAYSLVRVDPPLPDARTVATLSVALSGLAADYTPPSDAFQQCTRVADGVTCHLHRGDVATSTGSAAPNAAASYLSPSLSVPSAHPRIVTTAAAIAGSVTAPRDKIPRLVDWLQRNVKQEAVDTFSALDVLDQGKAECQGHSNLYAALARAQGIPTKVVNGLVYSDTARGFLYHTWTESLVDGHWLPVDPTFAHIGADATHIKLVEGENPADLLPLADMVGRIGIRVIAVATAAPK